MGYYYIDEKGKKQWQGEEGDPLGAKFPEWKDLAVSALIVLALWLAVTLLSGCATKRTATMQKDSITVVDSVSKKAIERDSLVTSHKENFTFDHNKETMDSVVVSLNQETTTTIMVDSMGRELWRNTVTIIERNRDRFRDTKERNDTSRTISDSITQSQYRDVWEAMSRAVYENHQRDTTTVIEKRASLWDSISAWVNGLCVAFLLFVLAFIAWKIYKTVH